MQLDGRRESCDRLRELMDRVRALEEGGGGEAAGAEEDKSVARVPTGLVAIAAALGGGLRRGAVHEWVGVGGGEATARRRDGATKGERGLGGRWTAPVCVLTHLAREALRARESGVVVWVGRRVWVYGRAMVRHQAREDGEGGRVDDALLRRSIFVDAPDDATRLWAMDLALRCEAVACVVGDGRGFDVAATRRLQLGARAGGAGGAGAMGLLARPPTDGARMSVSSSRWLVGRAPASDVGRTSGALRGGESGGMNPRWIVELVRCKGLQPVAEAPRRWCVEWNCETDHLSLVADVVGGSGRAAEAERGLASRRIGA